MHISTSPTIFEFYIAFFTLFGMGIGLMVALVEARAKDRRGVRVGLVLLGGFAVFGLGALIFFTR